jgi:predicted permease
MTPPNDPPNTFSPADIPLVASNSYLEGMRVRLKHEQLVELVRSSSISQNHWAMRLGISRGHFSDLLHGKYPFPSGRTQARLLEVFNAEFDDLFVVDEERDDWTVGSRADFQAAIADRFLVDEEVGRGGMGTVYLARDIKHGRRVAIKVISPEVVSGIGSARFLREIRRSASLDHHHILTLIDSGVAAGYPFYVMPYVSGGSLRRMLDSRGRFALPDAVTITTGIAKGLRYAHDQNVVHCDIKPENILFSEEHPYIADFGIARTIHAEARAWKRVGELDASAGTPAYVSPEQVLGEMTVDGRADVYSLGCVVFEMLTGVPPFEGKTTMQAVAKRFTENIPNVRDYVADISPEVAAIVRRAMDLDPRQRFDTVSEFVLALHFSSQKADTMTYRMRSIITNGRHRLQKAMGARPGRRPRWLDLTTQHVTSAFRSLRRSPGFAIAAVLTLGLGIGSNATMLDIMDRLLLRPPPHVQDPGTIHRIYVSQRFLNNRSISPSISWPDIEDLLANEHFENVAAQFSSTLTMGRLADAQQVRVNMVTPSYFELLGVRPFVGRLPLPDENTPFGQPSVAVLTHGAWQRMFGGDQNILGRQVSLGSGDYTIIGITPPGFSGIDLRAIDMFVPIRSAANENIGGPWETSRGIKWIRGIVRRRAASSVGLAENVASEFYRAGTRDRPSYDPEARIIAGPLMEASGPWASADSQVARWLAGVSLIVLLIACANVANLLLARSVRRRREMAIRLALGVSRLRLITQLLTESLVLALVAGAGAAVLARWGGDAIRALLLPNLDWSSSVFDFRLIGLTVAIVLVAGVGTGVVPAILSSRSDVTTELKSGVRAGSRRRSTVRTGLTVAQTALSVVLLVGAGLFLTSLHNVRQRHIGFDLDRVLVATADYDEQFGAEDALQFYEAAEENLRALPGVLATGLSNSVPFRTNWAESLEIPGIDTIPATNSGGPYVNAVSHGYYAAMGLSIVRGRGFAPTDRAGTAPVTIVSETMARLVWRGEEPIGHCMIIGPPGAPCATIIGVAGDVTQQNLIDSQTMVYYVLLEQYRDDVMATALFVRSENPREILGMVRQALNTISPQPPFVDVNLVEDLASSQVRPWRLGATMFTLFGILALVVAAVGLYSVVAFDVAQRRHELGVRTALGATAGNIMSEVITDTLRLTGLGVGLGVIGALLATSAIRPLLFDVGSVHAPTYLTTVLVLVVSGVAAAALPAWRATRVHPIEALRVE